MKKTLISILLGLTFCLQALAQTDLESTPTESSKSSTVETKKETVGDKVEGAYEVIRQKSIEASDAAEASRLANPYYAQGEWALLDMLIPSKWGVVFGYNQNAKHTWEFEYIRGSVSVPLIIEDLGEITEEKFSIRRRHFYGGAFNFFYGLDYLRIRVKLGSDLLNRVSGGQTEDFDALETGTIGGHLGIGSRWAISDNFNWGVDWITWTQPLHRDFRKDRFLDFASNESDKDDVRKALQIAEFFPRFTLFKLSVGLSF